MCIYVVRARWRSRKFYAILPPCSSKLRHVWIMAINRHRANEKKRIILLIVVPRVLYKSQKKAIRKKSVLHNVCVAEEVWKRGLETILPPGLHTRPASATTRTNVDTLKLEAQCHVFILHRRSCTKGDFGWDRRCSGIPGRGMAIAWTGGIAIRIMTFSQNMSIGSWSV